MVTEPEQLEAPDNGLTPGTLGIAFGLHVALFLGIFIIGLFNKSDQNDDSDAKNEKEEVIVPIDLTVVPPWAKKTNEEKADPRPPPPKVKQTPKQKQTPPKPQKTNIPEDNKAEKKIPPKSTTVEPGAFKKNKPVKKVTPTKNNPPPDPSPAPEIESPPTLDTKSIERNIKESGKATARENPPPNAKELLNKGYRPSDRTQLESNEAQLGISLIEAAVRREWDKEQFNWNSNLKKIQVRFQLGAGGMVRGYRMLSSSGDSEVDRTAQNALSRLKAKGRIDGLTPNFIKNYPEITILMEPTP